MRIDTSKLLVKEELRYEDSNSHTMKYFYSPEEVANSPEFRFQNQLIQIKENDHIILMEDLVDEIEKTRISKLSQAQTVV